MKHKKISALALAAIMTLSVLGATAAAASAGEDKTPAAQQTQEQSALKEKKVAAISVDVLASELGSASVKGESIVNSPLFEFDNFTISPHIAGGGTVESLDALGDITIGNISRIFKLN